MVNADVIGRFLSINRVTLNKLFHTENEISVICQPDKLHNSNQHDLKDVLEVANWKVLLTFDC